jgi:hypothetical protein
MLKSIFAAVFVVFIAYSVIGTGTRVDDIKEVAVSEIEARNWEVLRYEGYRYGSWGSHGGKVWYHVKDKGHENTYYRVYLTMWGGEIHFVYGQPEKLERINFDNGREK